MKYLFSLVVLFVFISDVCSQQKSTCYHGSIISGTDRRFKISINGQNTFKAKIIRIDGDDIIINEKGNTRRINRNTITNIEEIPFGSIGNVGIGFGIPYGILGFNLDINLISYLSVSAGFGTTIFAGIGYATGIKAYIRRPGKIWRPRLSAFYGVNGIYIDNIDTNYNEKFNGITVGVGQLVTWQRHGFDLDFMYLVNSGLYDKYGDDYNRFKISIGYRFSF